MAGTSSDAPVSRGPWWGCVLLATVTGLAGLACVGVGLFGCPGGSGPAQVMAAIDPPVAAQPGVRLMRTSPRGQVGGVPSRLVVPELGVESTVVPVALRHDVLTPPDEAWLTGWWSRRGTARRVHGDVCTGGAHRGRRRGRVRPVGHYA